VNTSGDTTVTHVLAAIDRGEAGASERLLPLVYEELRRLAEARMARESPGQTLQATALVHEAYVRLLGEGDVRWEGRGHFFSAAAIAMQRILVERARRRGRVRHGGGRRREVLGDSDAGIAAGEGADAIDLVALDGALARLANQDARLARVVQLRFFAGLSVEQTAAVLGASARTVKRDWVFARAWLRREIDGAGADDDSDA
jgi:RNA polymerase sigma factor (TIGR02999 family)